MKNLRIGIDARLAGKKHAGIGRYIENLIVEFAKPKYKDSTFVLFFQFQSQVEEIFGKKVPNHFQIQIINIPHYTLAEQFQLPAVFNVQKLDVLHVPHFNIPVFYGGKMIVTIHDLLWHSQRGSQVTTLRSWKYWLKYLGYQFVLNSVMTKAEKIIVPTKVVLKDILKHYSWIDKEIVVIPEGIEDTFSSKFKDNTKTHQTSNKLVYLGSLYPHKNVELVIRSLAKLPKTTLHVVGARSVFVDQLKDLVKQLKLSDQVVFEGYLSDSDLIKLLHSAQALVQPSFSEGFGLTGIEAMAVGCPVLASDIPTFKEVYSKHAIYFDPKSEADFIAKVELLPTKISKDMLTKARDWTNRYSWAKMASESYKLYQAV